MQLYESLAERSTQMLDAARRQDWDSVVALEQACAQLIERARRAGDTMPLAEADRRRKSALIRRLLAEDAEIRSLAQPWLADLERLLRSSRARERLEDAYR